MKQRQSKIEGNFFNCLMANNETIPVVGEYVTELQYLDRVTHIVKSIDGKKVKIQYCRMVATTGTDNQMGHQNWDIVPTEYEFDVVYRYGAWYKICNDWDKPTYSKIKLAFGVCRPYRCWEF